jgi:polyhydroxyalkanoate synthase
MVACRHHRRERRDEHHEAIVEFATRQMLDMVSPTNFIPTNPVLQQRISETGGQCLVEGARF